jgi:hypothetical protein
MAHKMAEAIRIGCTELEDAYNKQLELVKLIQTSATDKRNELLLALSTEGFEGIAEGEDGKQGQEQVFNKKEFHQYLVRIGRIRVKPMH